jgi:hypothetical protein
VAAGIKVAAMLSKQFSIDAVVLPLELPCPPGARVIDLRSSAG